MSGEYWKSAVKHVKLHEVYQSLFAEKFSENTLEATL